MISGLKVVFVSHLRAFIYVGAAGLNGDEWAAVLLCQRDSSSGKGLNFSALIGL